MSNGRPKQWSPVTGLWQLLYQKGFWDDICGDITPHVPSTRSLGWHIWHHAPGNVCWRRRQPTCSSPQQPNYVRDWTVTKANGLDYQCTGTSGAQRLQDNFEILLHIVLLSNTWTQKYKKNIVANGRCSEYRDLQHPLQYDINLTMVQNWGLVKCSPICLLWSLCELWEAIVFSSGLI